MPVLGEDGVLNWRVLGSRVPLDDIAGAGRPDDDVGLEGVKHGLSDLVLAGEGLLGLVLAGEAEDVDQAVRLVEAVLRALGVGDKQQFGVFGAPIHGGDGTLDLDGRLEHELLRNLLALGLLARLGLVVVIDEEIADDIELLVESALHDPTAFREEVVEIFPRHFFLCLFFGKNLEGVHHFLELALLPLLL